MKMSNSLVSIVIVGYNAAKSIKECLDSIYHQTYKDFEVIFIDNGSGDNTFSILKTYTRIKIIHNAGNRGFCAANNQGIRLARGEYIATVNTDIVLDKDFLKEMMDSNVDDKTGLLGAKILKRDGKTIDSTGLLLSRLYRFFDRGSGEIDKGQYDKEPEIFGPCAAAALYKRKMLEDIEYNGEYFDEDFFFLGEDFDISWRALRRGWQARFVPSAVCYHSRNSTNFDPKFRQYLSFRNRFLTLIKNRAIDLKYIPTFLFYDIPRSIVMLFTNRYTLKAISEIYRKRAGVGTPPSEIKTAPHILNIVQRYYPGIGGAEMYMKEISERFVRDGCKVTVFTTDAWDLEHLWKRNKRSIDCYKEVYKGVTIERFRAVKFPFHNIVMRIFYKLPFLFSKSLFSLPSPVVFGMWKRLFYGNHHGFDAVHVSAFPYNSLIYMGIRYAKKHGVPLIITPFLHLGEYKNDKVNRYYTRNFQMQLLDKCDKIIVQTAIESDYLKKAGIDNGKIYIVGQGVNMEDILGGDAERFRKKFDIREKDIIFHVAAKSYDKGTFHLVEAMKKLWGNNRDVKLVLAGPPMDEFNRYFSGQKDSVKDRCLVLDYIIGQDKKDLFAAGDIFVLPSRTDSFGVVFLEAWVNKKPVIGARAGGVTEVIKDKEDGYLVKFGDIDGIARCIERLLDDEKLANRMGERGFLKVSNGLTWNERYRDLKKVFRV